MTPYSVSLHFLNTLSNTDLYRRFEQKDRGMEWKKIYNLEHCSIERADTVHLQMFYVQYTY